jgi:hypothetical protein
MENAVRVRLHRPPAPGSGAAYAAGSAPAPVATTAQPGGTNRPNVVARCEVVRAFAPWHANLPLKRRKKRWRLPPVPEVVTAAQKDQLNQRQKAEMVVQLEEDLAGSSGG